MKQNNLVAKHSRGLNRATVETDRKKQARKHAGSNTRSASKARLKNGPRFMLTGLAL